MRETRTDQAYENGSSSFPTNADPITNGRPGEGERDKEIGASEEPARYNSVKDTGRKRIVARELADGDKPVPPGNKIAANKLDSSFVPANSRVAGEMSGPSQRQMQDARTYDATEKGDSSKMNLLPRPYNRRGSGEAINTQEHSIREAAGDRFGSGTPLRVKSKSNLSGRIELEEGVTNRSRPDEGHGSRKHTDDIPGDTRRGQESRSRADSEDRSDRDESRSRRHRRRMRRRDTDDEDDGEYRRRKRRRYSDDEDDREYRRRRRRRRYRSYSPSLSPQRTPSEERERARRREERRERRRERRMRREEERERRREGRDYKATNEADEERIEDDDKDYNDHPAESPRLGSRDNYERERDDRRHRRSRRRRRRHYDDDDNEYLSDDEHYSGRSRDRRRRRRERRYREEEQDREYDRDTGDRDLRREQDFKGREIRRDRDLEERDPRRSRDFGAGGIRQIREFDERLRYERYGTEVGRPENIHRESHLDEERIHDGRRSRPHDEGSYRRNADGKNERRFESTVSLDDAQLYNSSMDGRVLLSIDQPRRRRDLHGMERGSRDSYQRRHEYRDLEQRELPYEQRKPAGSARFASNKEEERPAVAGGSEAKKMTADLRTTVLERGRNAEQGAPVDLPSSQAKMRATNLDRLRSRALASMGKKSASKPVENDVRDSKI